ncbi:MAG TPA: hypothetical protein VM346_05360 [Sphingomicrobium sp.]|nr:hypothetical protein [Sphingomicrobium sp.]
MMMRCALPLVLLLLTACGDPRPAAPTAEESARLDEAEAMLDDEAKEEGPAANAPGPSD